MTSANGSNESHHLDTPLRTSDKESTSKSAPDEVPPAIVHQQSKPLPMPDITCEWTLITTPMSKCDYCSKSGRVLARNTQDKCHVCKECVDSGRLKNDLFHVIPPDMSWTPPPSKAKGRGKRKTAASRVEKLEASVQPTKCEEGRQAVKEESDEGVAIAVARSPPSDLHIRSGAVDIESRSHGCAGAQNQGMGSGGSQKPTLPPLRSMINVSHRQQHGSLSGQNSPAIGRFSSMAEHSFDNHRRQHPYARPNNHHHHPALPQHTQSKLYEPTSRPTPYQQATHPASQTYQWPPRQQVQDAAQTLANRASHTHRNNAHVPLDHCLRAEAARLWCMKTLHEQFSAAPDPKYLDARYMLRVLTALTFRAAVSLDLAWTNAAREWLRDMEVQMGGLFDPAHGL